MVGIIHHPFNVFWQQLDAPVAFVCRFPERCASEAWLTSGPAPHCVFKLRRRCYSSRSTVRWRRRWNQSAPSVSVKPSSSPLLPPFLSLSLSLLPPTDRPPLAAILRRASEPNHVVREARWLPGLSRQPAARPGGRTQADRQVRSRWWRGKAWTTTSQSAGREYRSRSRPSYGGKPG